jgi:four helix bundle protein
VRDHTSLKAWQRAREVTLGCGMMARDHWKPWAGAIFQQMLRASLSVQLNVAEGYAVRSPGRTRQHWVTAYGSCVETLDCLDLLAELDVIPRETAETMRQDALETSWMLLGLLRTLRTVR